MRGVVDVPKKLSKEQRKLIEQLGKATPLDNVQPRAIDGDDDEKPFFERVKDLFGS